MRGTRKTFHYGGGIYIILRQTPLFLRYSIFEVTLWEFEGGEYLLLPDKFGYCRYAVP